jgi:DNA-binding NarL/FixJ family response regulator
LPKFNLSTRTNTRAEATKQRDTRGTIGRVYSHYVVPTFPRDETMYDEKKTEDETMHELMVIKEAGPSEMQRLTPRERGIAHLVCAGLTNKQIAQELAVTEGTIKVHLHNVYDKLAIRNRTTLALLCVKQIEAVE